MKELPATLLLRPFNFNTLATRTHEKASLENLAEAAPAAILVIAVGLVAVALAGARQPFARWRLGPRNESGCAAIGKAVSARIKPL